MAPPLNLKAKHTVDFLLTTYANCSLHVETLGVCACVRALTCFRVNSIDFSLITSGHLLSSGSVYRFSHQFKQYFNVNTGCSLFCLN